MDVKLPAPSLPYSLSHFGWDRKPPGCAVLVGWGGSPVVLLPSAAICGAATKYNPGIEEVEDEEQ